MPKELFETIMFILVILAITFVIAMAIEAIKDDPKTRRKKLIRKLMEDQEKRDKYLRGL